MVEKMVKDVDQYVERVINQIIDEPQDENQKNNGEKQKKEISESDLEVMISSIIEQDIAAYKKDEQKNSNLKECRQDEDLYDGEENGQAQFAAELSQIIDEVLIGVTEELIGYSISVVSDEAEKIDFAIVDNCDSAQLLLNDFAVGYNMGIYKKLSVEEEIGLISRIQNPSNPEDKKDAMNILFGSHLPLILKVMKESGIHKYQLADFLGYIAEEMEKAAFRFDFRRGSRYGTYARVYIRTGINNRFLERYINSKTIVKHKRMIEEATERISRENDDHLATREDLINDSKLGLSERQISNVEKYHRNETSYEEYIDKGGALASSGSFEDELVNKNELQEVFEKILHSDKLCDKDRLLIYYKFYCELSLEEICDRLNMTTSQYNYQMSKLLGRMRKYFLFDLLPFQK